MEEPLLAARAFRDAILQKPDAASAHSGLARALVLSGEPEEAALEAERALVLDGSCAEAHALLGQFYEHHGMLAAARAHFRKYLEIDSVTVTALGIQKELGTLVSTAAPVVSGSTK